MMCAVYPNNYVVKVKEDKKKKASGEETAQNSDKDKQDGGK
jgi:hypothetical protein